MRTGQAIAITRLGILLAGKRLIAFHKVIIVTAIMCVCLQITLAKPGAPVIGRSLRYCNPLPLEASSQDGSPRGISLGDVTVVLEGNQYYMFCTGGGAWISQDLVNWQYRPVQGRVPVAPGIVKYKGTFYMSGTVRHSTVPRTYSVRMNLSATGKTIMDSHGPAPLITVAPGQVPSTCTSS